MNAIRPCRMAIVSAARAAPGRQGLAWFEAPSDPTYTSRLACRPGPSATRNPLIGVCCSRTMAGKTTGPLRTSSRGRRPLSRPYRILLLCLRLHGTYRLLAIRTFVVRPRLVAFSAHCHPHWPTALGAFGRHSYLGLPGWIRSRGRRLAGVTRLVQSPFTRAGYVSPGHGWVIRLGSL
jgi:hypothetical protein